MCVEVERKRSYLQGRKGAWVQGRTIELLFQAGCPIDRLIRASFIQEFPARGRAIEP